MGRKTSAAKKIENSEIYAQYDNYAKKLLAEKPILARIFKEVVTEVKEMCNLSEGIAERVMNEGIAQGRTEGLAKGCTEGH